MEELKFALPSAAQPHAREPVLVGTLRGQDLGKAFLLLSIVIGTVLATIGGLTGTQAFVPLLQLFRDFK